MKSICLMLSLTLVLSLTTVSVVSAAEPSEKLLTTQTASGDLAGWKAFHQEADTQTGDVWQLSDGVLSCKGTPNGYIYTQRDYANFVLKLQWRWPPGKEPGSGGVLIHTTGPNKIWPKSLEAQINAGDAGAFWGLGGYELTGPQERRQSLEHLQFGKLTNLKKTQAAEKKPGEWNSYEIIAEGDTVTLIVNGKVVNKATGCKPAGGRICLTAEGDEIQFRNVRLTPIVEKN